MKRTAVLTVRRTRGKPPGRTRHAAKKKTEEPTPLGCEHQVQGGRAARRWLARVWNSDVYIYIYNYEIFMLIKETTVDVRYVFVPAS